VTRRRILIVDDNPGVVALVTTVLAQDGNAIRTAGTGEEALALLAREPADVVVLDVDMPGLSGWETLRAIRSDPKLAAARVIMHSATEPLSPPDAAFPAPDGVVSKPSPIKRLLDVVHA
jgi:CheY-like chemotaxis protein